MAQPIDTIRRLTEETNAWQHHALLRELVRSSHVTIADGIDVARSLALSVAEGLLGGGLGNREAAVALRSQVAILDAVC